MNSISLESTHTPAHDKAVAPNLPQTLALALLVLLLLMSPIGWSAAELENVEFSALPGNQVRIDLILSAPTSLPKGFATDSPARIALDFEGVKNTLDQKSIPISIGPVQSLVAVEASNRTRVVINLAKSVPYRMSANGNRVTISINESAAATASAPRSTAPSPQRSASRPPQQTGGSGVRDIDFRRGPNGEGRVLITLPSANTRVAVTEKGKRIVVDILDAALPSRLLRRLDVVDFATPVVAVESRPKGRDVQVDIETGSEYEYLAYQADQLFTVEFRPLTAAEKERMQREKIVYSGDRLSLNFQDIEVRAVLQLLADFTGLNLVASDTVRGNITLRLKNVPWDQSLDIILKTKGLSMRQTGNVIMVAPTQEIAAQEKLELESQRQIEELAPLRSEVFQINYHSAAEIQEALSDLEDQGSDFLQGRGTIISDAHTNKLIVKTTANSLDQIRNLITEIDVPSRQVMIESRIVIANNDFARDLGVRFGYSLNRVNTNKGKFGEVTGGLEGTYEGDGYWGSTINDTIPLLVDLPAATPSGAVNLLIGKIGSYLLQLELSAMQREGRGEIVSSPRVITSDKQQATIKVGQEIPYQESAASGRTSVSFKEAVLQLDVTPLITPDDRILMKLEVKKDNPDYSREILGVPPIDTRSVETSVVVDNGETVVLGGVYEREKAFSKEQVPWLGNLPILGHLFKTTSRTDLNEELLIFVTPKVLKEDLATR